MTRTAPHLPVLLSLVGLGVLPTSEARAQALACGANVTTNTTLTADIVCPAAVPGGRALNIGADNVTVNFNGFEIRLAGTSGSGILVSGRSGTTLQNVRVTNTAGRYGVGITLTNVTNTTVSSADLDNGGTGLSTGISATGTNVNLDIANANVNNASTGITLTAVDATSSLTGSTFSGTTFGLRLLTGTNGFGLDAADGNSFANAGLTSTGEAIRIQGTTNVTIDGLNLDATTGIGIRVDNNNSGAILTNNSIRGRSTGIYSTGATDNNNLTITNNNVSNSLVAGMYLDAVNPTLVLTNNVFNGSSRSGGYGTSAGLRLQDMVGPWTLDTSNTFVGCGTFTYGTGILLTNTQNVTVSGFSLTGTTGTGILLSGTTNTLLDNNTLTGRRIGIDTTTTVNPGLTITNNNVSSATSYGMQLIGVNNTLVLTGNTFTNSTNGLYVNALTGPWTLSPTNVFTNVAPNATSIAVRFRLSNNVTIDGLNLSRAGGAGYGLRLESDSNFTIRNNVITGRNVGILADGTNSNFTIRDNDVSSAIGTGIQLARVNGLTLYANDYTNDRNGVRLDQLTNTPTIDFAGSVFDNIGTTMSHNAVYVLNSSNVALNDITATTVAGAAVRVDTGSRVNVTNLTSCYAGTGVDYNTVTNSVVDYAIIGAAPAGTSYGVDVAGGGSNTFRNSDTLVDVPLRDVGVSPATASSNLTVMGDADADGLPDVCDACPTDPANNNPCVITGCAGGDGVTDVDADGWCAGTGNSADCDDAQATVYPGAPELCDGLDNNCSGRIDEGSPFADVDGDTCNDCANGPSNVANDGTDTDADGLCDLGDPDDDNDTVADASDGDPLDAFVCQDTDLDSCDDCSVAALPQVGNDGTDTDSDGFCNTSDFTLAATVLVTKPSWNANATAGAGSPTVVWDTTPAVDQYVMVYETQTGANGTNGCANGVWTLGVATSTNGVTWTDAGSALVSNSSYYSCSAAHPTAVRQTGASDILVFFKGEDTSGFRGIGRLVMTWNAGTNQYTVSTVDPSPAMPLVTTFGNPKAVYDNAAGLYRIAYAQKPDVYVTSGTGTSFGAGSLALARNFAPWAPDEVISPSVTCEADGSYFMYVGGRDYFAQTANLIDSSMGRRQSARGDFATWSPGPGALVNKVRGDPDMRHWDVLRAGTEHILFFSEKQGGNGPLQVRMGWTGTAQPTPSTTNDKVCQ